MSVWQLCPPATTASCMWPFQSALCAASCSSQPSSLSSTRVVWRSWPQCTRPHRHSISTVRWPKPLTSLSVCAHGDWTARSCSASSTPFATHCCPTTSTSPCWTPRRRGTTSAWRLSSSWTTSCTRLMPQQARKAQTGRRGSLRQASMTSFGVSSSLTGSAYFRADGTEGASQDMHNVKEVSHALVGVARWDFNIFTLEDATEGRPLCALTVDVLFRLGLMDAFLIDPVKLKRFLVDMEVGYHRHDALYHTSTHAADVLQAMFAFFQNETFAGYFTPLEQLAACLACVGHDLDHPGVTNNYLIATGSELAMLYNDVAVLESHHSASFFKALQHPDANILAALDTNEYRRARKLMCSLILATDVGQHFEHLAKFKTRVSSGLLSAESESDRLLLLIMAIKCADVSNPTKPFPVYEKWTGRIMEEFYRQGDREREQGMPVSMFMDRTAPNIAKCQNGFIEVIVAPIFKAFTEYIGMEEPRRFLESNHAYWKQRL
eukprot:Opistho-1_new@102850